MRDCHQRRAAPAIRGGVMAGLFEVGFCFGEKLIKGRSIQVGGGECGRSDKLCGLSRPGRLVNEVPLGLCQSECEDDLRFLRSLLFFRFRLLYRLGLLRRLRFALRFRGLAGYGFHRSVLLCVSGSLSRPQAHPGKHSGSCVEDKQCAVPGWISSEFDRESAFPEIIGSVAYKPLRFAHVGVIHGQVRE